MRQTEYDMSGILLVGLAVGVLLLALGLGVALTNHQCELPNPASVHPEVPIQCPDCQRWWTRGYSNHTPVWRQTEEPLFPPM